MNKKGLKIYHLGVTTARLGSMQQRLHLFDQLCHALLRHLDRQPFLLLIHLNTHKHLHS